MAREKKNAAAPIVAAPTAPTPEPAALRPESGIEKIEESEKIHKIEKIEEIAEIEKIEGVPVGAAPDVTFVLGGQNDGFGEFEDDLVEDGDDGDDGEDGEDGEDGDVPFEQMDELADAVMHVAEQLSTADGESFADVLAGIRQQLAAQNEVLDKQFKVLYKLYASLSGK